MSFGIVMSATEDDPIRKFQAELQELGNRAERLRPLVKACEEAIQRAEAKATVSVGQKSSRNPKVEIMMFCKRLDETIPVFRELAKEGLRTDKSDSHNDRNVFDIMAMREYNLGPDVSLMCMLLTGSESGEGGAACRMEQVGVEEVPVYEVKCD